MKNFVHFINTSSNLSKGIILSLSTIISVIVSMKIALLGLCSLIFFDLITGIRANLHRKNIKFNPLKIVFWKSIKSYLLRKTWRKAYEYGIGIIVIIVFENLIFGTPMSIELLNKTFSLAELATIIPSLVEVWSIFENLEKVSKRNFLKKLITLLPEKFQKLITKDSVVEVIKEELPEKEANIIEDVINEIK